MKLTLLLLFLFLYSVDSRFDRDEDEIEEIKDLLSESYPRRSYRPSKPYANEDEEDGSEYIPKRGKHRNKYPSRNKVSNDEDVDDNEGAVFAENSNEKTTISPSDANDKCVDRYELRTEQFVKIKDLKNGAHMIRYVLLDKRELNSKYNIRQYCMMSCCAEKKCDIAMLSEKPSQDGYKCYLFACNGTCPLTSHADYTIIFPKVSAGLYSKSLDAKMMELTSTTATDSKNAKPSPRTSFFRETSVIIFLIFGLLSTMFLIVFLFRYCRGSMKRGRKTKNYEVDADYLINGLYL